MGYLDRERKVLELIHKRVGWKLADEDLQGGEQTEGEGKGKRQTDGEGEGGGGK